MRRCFVVGCATLLASSANAAGVCESVNAYNFFALGIVNLANFKALTNEEQGFRESIADGATIVGATFIGGGPQSRPLDAEGVRLIFRSCEADTVDQWTSNQVTITARCAGQPEETRLRYVLSDEAEPKIVRIELLNSENNSPPSLTIRSGSCYDG